MTRPVNHRLPVLLPTPRTYGDCCTGTELTGTLEQRATGQHQCRVYQCRKNLLRTDSQDVPGRRRDGVAPEGTFSGANVSASAPSCAIDVANAHPAGMSNAEVAGLMGLDKRRCEQIVKAWRENSGAVELYRLRQTLMGDEE